MIANNNVSVEKIQQGIEYLESEFMVPLTKVGGQLIEHYKDLNTVLESETINNLIKEQQNKLDELQVELKGICDRAKTTMDDSSNVIKESQVEIDETIAKL